MQSVTPILKVTNDVISFIDFKIKEIYRAFITRPHFLILNDLKCVRVALKISQNIGNCKPVINLLTASLRHIQSKDFIFFLRKILYHDSTCFKETKKKIMLNLI